MMAAVLVWVVTAATLALFLSGRWWLPEAINAQARSWDSHFNLTFWIMGAVFAAAQLALSWVVLRYRSSGEPVAESGSHGNNKLELVWMGAAAVVFVGLSALSTAIWAGVHLERAPAGAMRIEAVAKQFAWNFRYQGPDGKFGRVKPELISDANGNPFGLDDTDEAGRDDITMAALRIPAGTPVVLEMQSRDVLHNFFVRELRIKQDLVPGMRIPLRFSADKPGTYEVACSELCGLGHHQMRTQLIVMGKEEFQKWQQETLQQLGVITAPESR
ncbi:MAG: cytochrome c oxidase subunit II [Acidobacteria bacterium]|nr:cytochrome c oxidase subunit II [Acidobacteriota bacterium]